MFGMPNISTGMYLVLFVAVVLFMVLVPWPLQTFIVLAGIAYFLIRIMTR